MWLLLASFAHFHDFECLLLLQLCSYYIAVELLRWFYVVVYFLRFGDCCVCCLVEVVVVLYWLICHSIYFVLEVATLPSGTHWRYVWISFLWILFSEFAYDINLTNLFSERFFSDLISADLQLLAVDWIWQICRGEGACFGFLFIEIGFKEFEFHITNFFGSIYFGDHM